MSEDKGVQEQVERLYTAVRVQNSEEHNRVFSIMGIHTALMVFGLGLSIYVAVSLGDLIKDMRIQHRVTLTHFDKDEIQFAKFGKRMDHDDMRMDNLNARITQLEKEILKR